MEQLRQHLNIERWLVFGVSWGCTLGLAYAERHPERVTEIVFGGVTTGRYQEIEWLFRGGVSIFFPEQWERLRLALPVGERDGDIVAAYYRWLNGPDLASRQQAADPGVSGSLQRLSGLHQRNSSGDSLNLHMH